MQFKSFMEALKGNQHKIDKNKNGKIDAHDFKLLQKEEEIEESETSPSGRKSHKEIVFNSGKEKEKKPMVGEEMSNDDKSSIALQALVAKKNLKQSQGKVKSVSFLQKMKDRVKAGETVKEEMSDDQMKKREEIVKSMKKDKAGFKDRYGDRAETVMYATATKMAMKEEAEELDEKSDQAKQNKTMKNMMDASRGARFKLNNPVPDAEPEHKTARAQNVAIGRALRKEGYYEKPASAYRRKGDEIGGGSSKNDVPFDGPYTKATGNTTDKSGAVHSPMSRAKHLAKMAMKKSMKEDIDRLFEKDDSEYNYEGEMAVTQLKTISRHAEALQAKMKPDTNLPEWVQSKITLATDYMQTAHDYLMSELDEQAPVAPVPGMKFKDHAVMVHPKTKSRVVINRKNIDNYTSDGYKEVRPGQKLKEDEEVKFSYTELMMINEIKLADLPVRRIKGHSYGADYSDPEGADDYDDKKPMKPTAEKRGRGRPAGSQSGARKNFGSSKLHTK